MSYDSVYTYTESTGTVVADTSDILTEVKEDVVDVFGCSETAVDTTSSIMGRLAEATAAERKSIAINNALIANQINPNLAEEFAFDAIYALFGGERDGATRSSCPVTLAGVAGTIIESGSYIRNNSTETLWYTAEEVELDDDGSGSVTVYADDTGEVTAEAGELTEIVSAVNGWETVTNDSAATEGSDQQSLTSGKTSRTTELALNAGTTLSAVISNVNTLDGVIGVVGRENRDDDTATIDNIDIPGKSTWLCVDGGDVDEIAEQYVIHTHGTAFYGFSETESGSYTDSITGQEYSEDSGFPVYVDRPTEVPIEIEVTADLTSSSDLETQIKLAVQAWAAGNVDGYDGCVLSNSEISPFEIGGAINKYFSASNVYISSVKISTVADDSLDYAAISLEIYQKSNSIR